MFVEKSVELAMPKATAEEALRTVRLRDLAGIATEATSSGEALLERSGLVRLDDASQCHFGIQLGRPMSQDSLVSLQLRWWNDRARSLTPGFIGELQIRREGEKQSLLTISGEYHPRAHLYELVDRAFLARMAKAVAANFVTRLRSKLLKSVQVSAA